MGQSEAVYELTGEVAMWLIPMHLSFAFQFTLMRFLQCQLKTGPIAWVSGVALVFHMLLSWIFVDRMRVGIVGTAITLDFSWWLSVLGLFVYSVFGWCPHSWNGFSEQTFHGLWEFFKLSFASGVMLSLENFYYRVLIIVSGNMKYDEVAVDALSICITIYGWESMIPLGFFAATGVRVANELGAKRNEVNLSGVAVGYGWQALVAVVNVGSYYVVGMPLGIVLGWFLNFGMRGIWAGMIIGTMVQTLILVIMTVKFERKKQPQNAHIQMDA